MAKPTLFSRRLTAVTLGVCSVLLAAAGTANAAGNGDSFGILRQGTDLEQCLSRGSTSISFETQTTVDGAVKESTRVTHVNLSDDSQRLVECTQSHNRCVSSNLIFPLSVQIREIESHSAWDASDRMRLTDLIVNSLSEEAEGSGNFVAIKNEEESAYHLALTGKSTQTPDLVLESTIRYFGSLMITEGLNTWFAPSHSAVVEMRLLDRRNNKTFATRAIKISIPLALRSRDTSESTDRRWLELVRQQVQATGMSLLEEFRCAPQLMTAKSVSDSRVIVNLRGIQGLNQGQGMLLVPRSQLSVQEGLRHKPSSWPIVRLSQISEQRAEADLISGSTESCRSGDCVAIPL